MLKLYKFDEAQKQYWETWDNGDGTHTIHWGELGTHGQTRKVKGSTARKPEDQVQEESDAQLALGFQPPEEEFTMIIQYEIDGFGTPDDLDKRHKLEDRLNETLGWNGLGDCDGGSIGSGTMETFSYVVDFEIAKRIVESDLKGTEFENYSRIYCGGD